MARDSSPAVLDAYGRAVEQFEALGGLWHRPPDRRDPEWPGPRFARPGSTAVGPVGGQRTRVGWLVSLIAEPSLLILDEPTNHLDIAALEWLESFLANYAGAALIVSHDRTFLDATVSRILELDGEIHRLTSMS